MRKSTIKILCVVESQLFLNVGNSWQTIINALQKKGPPYGSPPQTNQTLYFY